MGLIDSNVSKNLDNRLKVWRYMSLDKLVNLLDTKSLYFSPIAAYKYTDPFEGLLPKSFRDSILATLIETEHSQQRIDSTATSIFNMLGSYVVNCWHQNNHESEAMWQLYSDNKKGVAIQSTIGSLKESIISDIANSIVLTEVQYLDLYSETPVLSGFDHIKFIPIYKRMSFRHENEVRLICRDGKSSPNFNPEETTAVVVNIEPSVLIEKIYISPYASAPYGSSVRAILKKFDLPDDKIISSQMLTPDENLKRLF